MSSPRDCYCRVLLEMCLPVTRPRCWDSIDRGRQIGEPGEWPVRFQMNYFDESPAVVDVRYVCQFGTF